MVDCHLAQANFAHMRGALDDPVMQGFVSQLGYINSVADKSPGFVWRLQSETGDATAIRVFDDELILFNMSVWESTGSLFDYVYHSDHGQAFRDRRNWFLPLERPTLILWWIPKGSLPSVEEAVAKLEHFEKQGPGSDVFTFKNQYSPMGEKLERQLIRN
jgi:hypothetical protein